MSENWEDEVLQLLSAGRKLDAIAVIRSHTGMSLAESKQFAESLMRGGPQSTASSDDFEREVVQRFQESGKIAAIKLYREEKGVGLKDAKLAVEEIARQHGLPQSTGCASVILLGMLGAGWWWFA